MSSFRSVVELCDERRRKRSHTGKWWCRTLLFFFQSLVWLSLSVVFPDCVSTSPLVSCCAAGRKGSGAQCCSLHSHQPTALTYSSRTHGHIFCFYFFASSLSAVVNKNQNKNPMKRALTNTRKKSRVAQQCAITRAAKRGSKQQSPHPPPARATTALADSATRRNVQGEQDASFPSSCDRVATQCSAVSQGSSR